LNFAALAIDELVRDVLIKKQIRWKSFFLTSCQIKFIFGKMYFMEILSVGELKANFSEILKRVSAGEEINIAYGKKKEVIARLVPKTEKKAKRKIGLLEGKAKVSFSKNFKITEEAFLNA